MMKLRLVLLATSAITAMSVTSTVSYAQTAPLVVAQAPADEVGPDGKPKPKEAPKGAPPHAAPPPAAAPPHPAPPPPPPPAAAPPPRPAPPPPPPPAPPVNVAPLEAKIAALENKPAPPPPPPVDLSPLEAKVAALENKPAPPPPPPPVDLAPLEAKIAALGQDLTAAKTQATRSDEAAARARELGVATLALSSGQKLGPLPGAPPALQRFATEAPPTEAGLRLTFEQAAKAAEAAGDPAAGSTDVGERIWQRVQSLVTVRRGDKILVGAPASVVLAETRRLLVAGDLAGAVASLDKLDPAAAKAIAGWRAQAQSLLDARAALASFATGAATP